MSEPKTAYDRYRQVEEAAHAGFAEREKALAEALRPIPADAPEQIATLKAKLAKVTEERDEAYEDGRLHQAKLELAARDRFLKTVPHNMREASKKIRAEKDRADRAEADLAAARTQTKTLKQVLTEIAHPGEIFGEGDYYVGVEAGMASAAELANDALEANGKAK